MINSKLFDHTLLSATATKEEVVKLCEEAKKNSFKSVCVNPSYIPLAKSLLKESDVLVCTVVGFPLGMMTSKAKLLETKDALKLGADEVDMVINQGRLKDKDYDYIFKEIYMLKKVCGKKCLKVILETCNLTPEEIEIATELAIRAKADFVKTSTGFASGGATVDAIQIMKKVGKENIEIKASGGVRTLADVLKFTEAGATRIGASKSVQIIEEAKHE